MGKRGPAPTPTAILKLRGSWRGEARKGEPEPSRGIPKAPESLSKEQKTVWKQVCKLLDEMEVLTVVDGLQLERYCVYLLRWRQVEAVMAKFSTPEILAAGYVNDDSSRIISGATRESHRLDAALKQIEGQFGLTPAARVRLSGVDQSKQVEPEDYKRSFFA